MLNFAIHDNANANAYKVVFIIHQTCFGSHDFEVLKCFVRHFQAAGGAEFITDSKELQIRDEHP